MKPEINKTYKVIHSRKGKFTMHVTDIDGEWVSGFITGGRAKYLADNDRLAGEEITIRQCLCAFKEVGGVEITE